MIVKRILAGLLCLLITLSCVSCGKGSSAFSKDPQTEEKPAALWSIYIYMVGSDLEEAGLDQLSKFTNTLVEDDAKRLLEEYDTTVADRIKNFTEELYAQGIDLPNALYDKTTPKEEAEKNTDVDATGYGSYSLDLMINSEIPEGVQFIVQTGGAKRWQNPLVNPNRSQRFLIDQNGIAEVSNTPVVNMADPETLEDFAVFCKEYYPAQHEMMVFWDHGGAYSGFGIDQIYGTDIMTIREMAAALGNVKALYSPNKPIFDAIAWDACLMGNLETARLFADYADYYFGSAEELSGLGWGYDRIIEALLEKPDMDPVTLGKTVSQAYVDNVQLDGYYGAFPATFSVFDLNKIEPVYDAYSALAKKALVLSLADVDNLAKLSVAANKALSYAYGNCGGFNLIDLGQFMDNLSDFLPKESKAVKEALKQCVIHTCSTSYFEAGSGMSVYFPARATGTMSLRKFLTYMYDLSDNPDIDALYYYKLAGCLNDPLREYVEKQKYGTVSNIDYFIMGDIPFADMQLSKDGNLSMQLTASQKALTQSVSYGLAFLDTETDDVIYFSELPRAELNAGGKVSTHTDGTWPSLNGNELPASIVSEDSTQILYRVPIDYYELDCFMMFRYDKATKEYTITGLTLDMDNGTGLADRSVIEFDEGDEFSVVYDYGNLYSDAKDKGYVDFVYSRDLKIVDKPLSDGTYLSYIRVDDLRSDCYYSPIVSMTVENGKVADIFVDPDLNGFDTKSKE